MNAEAARLADELAGFLVEAKRATRAHGPGDREDASQGHAFERGPYLFRDSFVGSRGFIGEELVWKDGTPVWGMNYFGRSAVAELPAAGMMCLSAALRSPPANAPYRGPGLFRQGGFEYRCVVEGDIEAFTGRETIEDSVDGTVVFELRFHGGLVF